MSCKLILCGDVETNPGPSTEQMFQQLLSGQNAIKKELLDLIKQHQVTEMSIASLNTRLSDIVFTLRHLRVGCAKIISLEAAMESAERTVTSHAKALTD